jgi:hypothetical protein
VDNLPLEAGRARLHALPDPAQRRSPAALIEADALLVERVVSAQADHQADRTRPAPTQDDVAVALALVEEMRRQLERLEAQVVQLAKARRMTWPQIAAAQDQRSPQASIQRYQRLVTRLAERDGGIVGEFPLGGGRNA